MNRMEEYQALMAELDRDVPGLETTLDRARKKKRRRDRRILLPLTSAAACFAVFVLLVNFCAPVAYACSRMPFLKELAAAVTFSRSLSDAVENEYVQTLDLVETDADVTAKVEYLIVDQKQVNVFYRLDSDVYTELAADPDVESVDGEDLSFSVLSNDFGVPNGELQSITIDFVEDDVPGSLNLTLRVYSNAIAAPEAQEHVLDGMFSDTPDGPEYIAELEFLLEFDPEFTAAGKIFPVNRTVELEGQQITITQIEAYPTHLRVDIAESEDNTAWLKELEFYIETDWGMTFEPVSSGITATGGADSKSMISYRADSTYFYEAEHLKLVITGARWLRKDMETTYLNLTTGESGPMPEGVEFIAAQRENGGWTLTFHAAYEEGETMRQLFDSPFYDAEGKEYTINSWSTMYGDPDGEGNITYYRQMLPLRDYAYEEVWLSPAYSHEWTAEDPVVITAR